jgi:hypothetical protein
MLPWRRGQAVAAERIAEFTADAVAKMLVQGSYLRASVLERTLCRRAHADIDAM